MKLKVVEGSALHNSLTTTAVNKVCPDVYRIQGRGCGGNREEEKEDKEEKNAVVGFHRRWESITRENGTIMVPTGIQDLRVQTQHHVPAHLRKGETARHRGKASRKVG